MTVDSLIQFCTQLGIRFALTGDSDERLQVDAPKGALTPSLREALGSNKVELIAWLKTQKYTPGRVEVDRPAVTRQPAISISHSEAKNLIVEQPLSDLPIKIERTDVEMKKLLAGREFDAGLIDAKDSATRQVVAAGLLASLASRNFDQHEYARKAFLDYGYFDEATRDLRTADSPAERAAAARKLGTVTSSLATAHLIAALYDSAPEVRRSAVESLGQIGDPAATSALEDLLLRENSRQLPEAVIRHAINSITVSQAKHSPVPEKPVLRIVEKPADEAAEHGKEHEEFLEYLGALKLRDIETTPAMPAPPQLSVDLMAEEERLRSEEEELRKAIAELERRRLAAKAARKKAEDDARQGLEREAQARAELEARIRAEQEARKRAEEEAARSKAEEEATLRAEEEARIRLEAQTLRRAAEELARKRAETELARKLAAEEARRRADEEARQCAAEEEARQRAEEERRRQLEEEARRIAEEARLKAELEARRCAEEEALRLAEEARLKVQEEARRKFEEEVRLKSEEEARRKIEEEVRRKAEEEARRRAEAERLLEEAEQRRQAEEEHLRLEQEALAQAAADLARRRAEIEASRKQKEEEARALSEAQERLRLEEEQARQQAQQERLRLEAETQHRMLEERRRLEEARQRSEEQKRQLEAEARRQADEEAGRLVELEALRRKAEEEGRRRIEQEQRIKAEIESLRRVEDEQRRRIEIETKRRAEVEARLKDEQARQQALEAARLKAEEETRRLAEEARARAEEETRRRLESEARLRAEEERRRAEESTRIKAEEERRRLAEDRLRSEEAFHLEEACRKMAEEARSQVEFEERLSSKDESPRGAGEIWEAAAQKEFAGTVGSESRYEEDEDSYVLEASPQNLMSREEEALRMAFGETPSEPEVTEWHSVETTWAESDRHEEANEIFEFSDEGLISTASVEPVLESFLPVADEPAETSARYGEPVKEIDVVRAEKAIEQAEHQSGIPLDILRRLNSEESSERAGALSDMARIGGDEAFLSISKAFDDQSADVRNAAASALYDLQPDRAASFTRALREGSPERRRRIGAALAASGLATNAIGNLTGESREKTYDAFSLLFLMAKAGEVQPLMRAIEDHANIEVRLAVVKLLALSGQPDIVPAFRRLAVRGSLPAEVRSAVMEAIYQISSQNRETAPSAA